MQCHFAQANSASPSMREVPNWQFTSTGVVNVVTSDSENADEIGKALCSSPLVAGLSFTGSTRVGKMTSFADLAQNYLLSFN